MSWQATQTWESAQLKAILLTKVRLFFAQRDVVEVETPLLSQGTVTDVYIDAFTSKYSFLADTSANVECDLYLQTSPEFAMKRLLASGYGSIYQISKAFRHEAFGRHHNPEFTILEWYRIGFDHFKLMDEVEDLLMSVLGCGEIERISYQALFVKTLGIDPLSCDVTRLISFLEERNLLSDWLLEVPSIDILLQFIFSEVIEPSIGKNVPCFVFDFPSSQASLAKISPHDNRVAERFECYFKGVELANGFNELTDAEQQLKRFKVDNGIRTALGNKKRSIDFRFINALNHGLPDCAGVALGIDRLMMIALDVDSIDQVISFPIEHA
ncbi:MAG: lysyl-tRNA synthetase class 2 [Alteromonadaceae bacterium]|jgi:lysyl-tRNA synthetase class 2